MFMFAIGLTLPAAACGGFFCTPAIAPIDQAAEEIVFAHDSAQGLIEMHIEITYEGRSDDFAWILPVPEEPELFLSSSEMFTELAALTAPSFRTNFKEVGNCREPISLGCSAEYSMTDSAGNYTDVDVVDQERIGPYETVTLRANSAAELLTWLVDNDYDLPQNVEPLLEVYVAEQSYFVAMRLAADSDVGDIEPIGMSYKADKMAIPIQLTAIAAAADMPLRVYVFGDSRAVPESYLHVEINEAAIDWLGQGSNYYDVVEAAANEADGHAFVTEFAGRSSVSSTGISPELARLAGAYPYLTRMTAVLSPDEMTVDPTFVFNADLPNVNKDHVADLVVDCSGGKKRDNAPMYIELADGRIVHHGENANQFGATDTTVADLQAVPALSISGMGASGAAELIADFAKDADNALAKHNDGYDQGGCGCVTAPLPSSIFGLGLVLLIFRRRRP